MTLQKLKDLIGEPAVLAANAFFAAEKDVSLAEIRAEHALQMSAKDTQLADQAAESNLARKAAADAHADAIAAKDAELAALADTHAAALAQAASDQAATVEAEGRAVHNRLDALVQAGQEAHAAGDLDALGKVLVAAYAHTSKARKAKLEADLSIAQAAVTAAADKLAAL